MDGKKDDWELGRKVEYFNGTLRKLRKERGLFQKDVAKAVGVSDCAMSAYETMKCLPEEKVAKKIADFYGKEVADIFPEYLRMISSRVPRTEIEYGKLTTKALEQFSQKQLFLEEDNSDPEKKFTQRELSRTVAEALSILSEREQKIVRMRYGLDGERPHTLEEVGAWFGVHKERVRQIEKRALGKIRASRYYEKLGGLMD